MLVGGVLVSSQWDLGEVVEEQDGELLRKQVVAIIDVSIVELPRHICDISTRINRPTMTPAALYLKVSTLDQHPETQLHDLKRSWSAA